MSKKIGVLAHYQALDLRPSTHVAQESADDLVRRMICERISSKLIRMLPPESAFFATRADRPPSHFLPGNLLPSSDPTGTKFKQPIDPAWQAAHGMATHSLHTRAFMTLKSWNPARSRSPLSAAALPTQPNASGLLAGNYWLAI